MADLELKDMAFVPVNNWRNNAEFPKESARAWREFFDTHPEIGRDLINKDKTFHRLSLVDAFEDPPIEIREDRYRTHRAKFPESLEEMQLIKQQVCVDDLVKRGCRRGEFLKQAEQLRLTQDNVETIVRYLLRRRSLVDTQYTLAYKKKRYSCCDGDVDKDLLRWGRKVDQSFLLNNGHVANHSGAFKTLAQLLPTDKLCSIPFSSMRIFSLVNMRYEGLRETINEDSSMGQLLLGNIAEDDKSWLVQEWLTRRRYVPFKRKNGHWYANKGPSLDCLNPVPAVCDIRGIKDKFFTSARLDSLSETAKQYPRLLVIARRKIVGELKSRGLAKVYTIGEYRALKEGTDDTTRVLRAAE